MHKEINKQAMWSVAAMLGWLSRPLYTERLGVLLYADQPHKIIRAIQPSSRGIDGDVLSIS